MTHWLCVCWIERCIFFPFGLAFSLDGARSCPYLKYGRWTSWLKRTLKCDHFITSTSSTLAVVGNNSNKNCVDLNNEPISAGANQRWLFANIIYPQKASMNGQVFRTESNVPVCCVIICGMSGTFKAQF